jgi:hypothetical protein
MIAIRHFDASWRRAGMAKTTPPLEKELATYHGLLPSLSAEDGRFALIAGDKLLGVFDTYTDALSEGYRIRGLDPFLVKKISAVEVAAFFTRDLRRERSKACRVISRGCRDS